MRLATALACACLVATTLAAQQQPLDTAYTRQIRAFTSEPRFNTDLTDHMVDDPSVPSPFDVLGYVPGTPGRLSYTADVHRYFRALAAASPRVRIFDAGRSEEGREMIAVAIADEATIGRLDEYRDITRRLSDPRGLSESDARALVARGKPIYYLTGTIHSPETASPEMLMELAYRLAVEDSPELNNIRQNVITVITPVQETDGRDRMVDIYNYGRANSGVRPPLVYWGKYTAHDNNRDGMVLSQALTRNVLGQYFYWHPTVQHDLHESVPFLYTSTGTGPYNRAIDAITVSEWNELAFEEIRELTKRGLPGVWTHNFYDGWTPNYIMFIAQLRNSVGRFYETYTGFGADCDTARVARSATSVEWFRPNPPLDGVRWCIRNNINYQQSGVMVALNHVATNGRRYLDNFYAKSRRAVERGRTGRPNLWHIPAAQPRRGETANLVNLLRQQGIEVHRATSAFASGSMSVAAGDYLVRLDQPYGPLANTLFEVQTYRPTDPAPYDDTGWTFGPLRNVAVHPVADTTALNQPMTLITAEETARGEIADGGGRGTILIPATTESNLIVFRYRLRDVRMSAAEDSFSVGSRTFPAGTVIVPAGGNDRAIRDAVAELGLSAVAVGSVPPVARHELDLPRIGLVHSWQNTQNEGWVRFVFDQFRIPYTYLSTSQLADSARLARLDVLVLPYVSDNARGIVNGLPMVGPPIPWLRTATTPNLVTIDSTTDVRPGIGLRGLATLQSWIRAGGTVITEGGTSAVFVEYGMAPGVDITEPRTLRARGTILRSRISDRRSPITYGYADTVSVYFNRTPLFQTDTTTERGSEIPRDSAVMDETRRARPRVVLSFGRGDSLLISGQLDNGSELAGRPAILDVQVGRGHVVMFAIRPFWRWQTQGSFAFGFNALLNWNDLGTGWPATPRPPRVARAAR